MLAGSAWRIPRSLMPWARLSKTSATAVTRGDAPQDDGIWAVSSSSRRAEAAAESAASAVSSSIWGWSPSALLSVVAAAADSSGTANDERFLPKARRTLARDGGVGGGLGLGGEGANGGSLAMM